MKQLSEILNNNEAAAYLTERGFKIDPSTLSTMTTKGVGPRFEKKWGLKIYLQEWLDAFLATVNTTTNEANNG